MCGRNRRTAPSNSPQWGRTFLAVLCLGLLCACTRTPEQQVAHDLDEALEDLYDGEADVDAYMECLDFGEPLDSVHYELYSEAIRQQLQNEGHEQKVTSWQVPRVKFLCATAATAFYTLYLANGDSICKGQKMVYTEGIWKLRMKD